MMMDSVWAVLSGSTSEPKFGPASGVVLDSVLVSSVELDSVWAMLSGSTSEWELGPASGMELDSSLASLLDWQLDLVSEVG
jgi:hypothetical protein